MLYRVSPAGPTGFYSGTTAVGTDLQKCMLFAGQLDIPRIFVMHAAIVPIPLTTVMIHPRASLSRTMAPLFLCVTSLLPPGPPGYTLSSVNDDE